MGLGFVKRIDERNRKTVSYRRIREARAFLEASFTGAAMPCSWQKRSMSSSSEACTLGEEKEKDQIAKMGLNAKKTNHSPGLTEGLPRLVRAGVRGLVGGLKGVKGALELLELLELLKVLEVLVWGLKGVELLELLEVMEVLVGGLTWVPEGCRVDEPHAAVRMRMLERDLIEKS